MVIVIQGFKITLWPALVTLTAFLVLCKLGFWQLQRADEKQKWLEAFDATSYASPALVREYHENNKLAELNGQKVTISAAVLTEQVMYLDNRIHQGQAGYKVLAALISEPLNATVLVDFGWLKAPAERHQLPSFTLPLQGTFTGTIKSTQLEQFVLENSALTNSWPQRIQSINSVFDHNWPLPMLPLVIYADEQQIDGLVQTYKPVIMPPEKHRAYALQWFLLALASVIVFLFSSRVTPENRRTDNS